MNSTVRRIEDASWRRFGQSWRAVSDAYQFFRLKECSHVQRT